MSAVLGMSTSGSATTAARPTKRNQVGPLQFLGGSNLVDTAVPGGGRELVPLTQRPPQLVVPSLGSFDNAHTVGTIAARSIQPPFPPALPATSTTPTTLAWSLPSHLYGGDSTLTQPSYCHALTLVCSAPVLSTVAVRPSTSSNPIIQFPPSPLPSSSTTPYVTPSQWFASNPPPPHQRMQFYPQQQWQQH